MTGTMGEAVLMAEELTVSRGGARVLNAVSFEVRAGEVFALLGGNGAGKSTTLLAFLGLLRPDHGSAQVFGVKADTHAEAVRAQVSYLPEAASLYGHLSARENLRYFLSVARVSRSGEEIEAALDRVGLQPEARERRVERYSKGMRQKAAIALSILRGTPVLLLDEPTSGLDPLAIDEFNALVANLSGNGTTILMVTHDVYGACQVAKRIGLLRGGELVGLFDASPDQRIDTEIVHAAFARPVAA